MKLKKLGLGISLTIALCSFSIMGIAQQGAAAASATSSAVPRLVNYSGVLTDGNGKALSGVVGVTFLLYRDEQGGAPLWLETQNVQADKGGHYVAVLGTTSSQGLPEDVFISGEARWLGVQVQGQAEQPRVLLVAVPYAMKARDAETIGGLPPSAFVLAAPPALGSNGSGSTSSVESATTSSSSSVLPPASTVTTSGGTANTISMFTTGTNIQNSILTQTGTTAINVGGKLNLPAVGTATATAGKSSRPEALVASAFNSGTATAVPQTFQLQAEPVGNNTATATGSLNLLFGQGTSAPTETGFKISNKGILTFAAGQGFPGTGTVKSVASGAGLTGGPITTSGTLSIAAGGVTNTMLQHPSLTISPGTDLTGGGSVALGGTTTLNLDTTKVPTLAGSNTFSATQTLNGGELLGNSIQAADGTFSLLVNSVDCCTFGTRMIWAHSPAFPGWGMFYDDNADFMHFRRAAGGEVLTISFGGLIGVNNATPGQALDVNGNINTNSSVLAAGDVDANGNVNVTGRVNSSGRGTFGSSTAGGQLVVVNNSGGTQALQIQNFTNPIGGFTEAQFNVNGGATFFTDAFGNTTATGTKSAAVPLASGNMVKVFSTESPEVWFEDFGFGQLAGGTATVTIDRDFTETASMIGYHVFVTPKGDCKGLYVTNESNGTFEVRELGGGQSNIEFDYRIVAHRKGYETMRLPAANLPKAIPVASTEAKPKHLLTLPAPTVAANPQLLYRTAAPAQKQAPKTSPKR